MRIAVVKETHPLERRVALVPDGVGRLVKQSGCEVVVERGAGAAAVAGDDAYVAAGATIAADAAAAMAGADVVVRVRRPDDAEAERLPEGTTLVAMLDPARNAPLLERLAARRVTALALELVPRITRAQSMDVLSSQATVVGYMAAVRGAAALPRLMPMLTTAAGSLTPARAFVIGAGVAGLQAIATTRRLGAVVSAFDVRPAAAEQVKSLGATFVASEVVSAGAEQAGGYAREQGQDERSRTLAAIGAHIVGQDLVITTAQVPGRPAPRLVTADMVRAMKPGSVIVDIAGDSGGNCELSAPGETRVEHGVTIMAPLDLASAAPVHASQMFSRNVLTLLQHLVKEGRLVVDLADEITGAMTVVHGGAVRAPGVAAPASPAVAARAVATS
jgi:H+-translocating NAD(P) transhydrogenase subunit alpha